MQAAQSTLATKQESHENLHQQLTGYTEQLAVADAVNRQFQAQVTDLEAQLACSQASMKAQLDRLTASEAEVAAAKTSTGQLQQQVLQLKQEIQTGSAAQQRAAQQLKVAVEDKALLERQLGSLRPGVCHCCYSPICVIWLCRCMCWVKGMRWQTCLLCDAAESRLLFL